MQQLIQKITIICLPFLLSTFIVAFAVNIVQVKWKVSFEPIKPKFDKFNPVNGVKRLFSKDKIMELLKSIAKICVIIYVVKNYLEDKWALVMNMYSYTLTQGLELLGDIIINIGLRISALFVVIAVVDIVYQKWKFPVSYTHLDVYKRQVYLAVEKKQLVRVSLFPAVQHS